MIEKAFIALWIVTFVMLCITVKKAWSQRARECRRNQMRELRRFTQECARPHRRRRTSYQPATA